MEKKIHLKCSHHNSNVSLRVQAENVVKMMFDCGQMSITRANAFQDNLVILKMRACDVRQILDVIKATTRMQCRGLAAPLLFHMHAAGSKDTVEVSAIEKLL